MENMFTVRQLLESKSSEIWSVTPETTVFEALQLMAEKDIGGVLVLNGGKLVGIFSERDYARKVILQGKASKEMPVSAIMTKSVLYVNPGTTVEECMALMTAKRVRHLPVFDKDTLVGIITIGDVVKKIILLQQFQIDQLEKYITGGYMS
jgi:CBS domain-containing protein